MSKESKEIYEFGPFRLNVGEHLLERTDGQPTESLPERAFQTLIFLVEHHGSLVTKHELLDKVWKDAVVEENSINKAIHAIRHALNDNPDNAGYIETVRKHGYRFVGDVRSVGPGALTEPAQALNQAGGSAANRSDPNHFRWVLGIGVLLVVITAVAFSIWTSESTSSSPGRSNPPLPPGEQKRLTILGGATRAAISQDGRYAAVAQNAALVLFDLETGEERVVVPASGDTRITSISFRPDDNTIYFGTRAAMSTHVTVYSIPLEGGEAAKLFEDIYGTLTFSPDSQKIAFVRRYAESNEYALLTANSDGSNITRLASSQMPNRLEGLPAWSPDGTTIICPAVSIENGFHFTVNKVDAASGAMERLLQQRWAHIGSLVWLGDTRSIMMAAQSENDVNSQIWRLDALTGEAVQVTNDTFVYESISGSRDARSLVAIKVRQSSHVWILDEPPVQITAGFDNQDGAGGLAWSPDGSIFYHSRANNRDAIWRVRPDGSRASEITPDTSGGFAVSPDGRYLVFQAKQSKDHLGLQIMDLADGTQRPLTHGVTAMTPAFYPDGKKVIFTVYDKKLALFETDILGREQRLVSDEFRAATAPSVSPSGRFVAYPFNRTQTNNLQAGIAIVDSQTKQSISVFRAKVFSGSPYEESTIQWSNDESEIYFIQLDNTVSNLMRLRVSDGEISRLTNFPDGRIYNFAVEPGGGRIVIARGNVERDASLIKLD